MKQEKKTARARENQDQQRRAAGLRAGQVLGTASLFGSKGKGTAAIHYGRLMTPREIYRLTASSN